MRREILNHEAIELPKSELINNFNTALMTGDLEGIVELTQKYDYKNIKNEPLFKEVLRKGLLNLRELQRKDKIREMEIKNVIEILGQIFYSES